jgi:hypothetical protein
MNNFFTMKQLPAIETAKSHYRQRPWRSPDKPGFGCGQNQPPIILPELAWRPDKIPSFIILYAIFLDDLCGL